MNNDDHEDVGVGRAKQMQQNDLCETDSGAKTDKQTNNKNRNNATNRYK